MGKGLNDVLGEAITKYNRYREPEARAELLSVKSLGSSKYLVKVLFRGSFINSCSVRDWVEDLAYLVKGFKAELKDFKEVGDGVIATFLLTPTGEDA